MDKTWTVHYQEFADYAELGQELVSLVEKAYESAERAYAPYSEFQVGAVLKLQDGTIISGNNQENIAYPSGLCAERVALFYAGANHADQAIERLVIVAKGDLIQPDDCLSPCGSCRQVIAESEQRQDQPIEVVLVSPSRRTFVFHTIKDLLIFPFGMH